MIIYIYIYSFPTFYMPTTFIIWTPRLFQIYSGIKLDHYQVNIVRLVGKKLMPFSNPSQFLL
jgi:hypothetical protein